MRRIALAFALVAAPSHAAAPSRELVEAFASLQRDDARINDIGYRLATANAPFCDEVRPSVGLLLLDAAAYRAPENIRSVLGISGDFAVQAAARGSPAQTAGLEPGDELLDMEGMPPDLAAGGTSPEGQVRLNALQDRIEAALIAADSVKLRFRSRAVALKQVPACHAHFELATSGKGAQAGSSVVLMSRALLSETRSDDEVAFVLAHELAHLVLGHQARRRAAGKSRSVILDTEREADRLGLWLMANAGYDPALAPAFLRRRGAKGLAALFPERHHDSGAVRARLAEQELVDLRAGISASNGLRDWRARFRPYRPWPHISP